MNKWFTSAQKEKSEMLFALGSITSVYSPLSPPLGSPHFPTGFCGQENVGMCSVDLQVVSPANVKHAAYVALIVPSPSVNLKTPVCMELMKPSCIKKYNRSQNHIMKTISLFPKWVCGMDHLHWCSLYLSLDVLQADQRYLRHPSTGGT